MTVSVGGQAQWNYRLDYRVRHTWGAEVEGGPTTPPPVNPGAASHLSSVTECVGAGDTTCKGSTTFNYSAPRPYGSNSNPTIQVLDNFGNGPQSATTGRTIVLDIDGDGLDDLLTPRDYTYRILRGRSDGQHFEAEVDTGIDSGNGFDPNPDAPCFGPDSVIDFDHDGDDDLISNCDSPQFGWQLYRSNGTNLVAENLYLGDSAAFDVRARLYTADLDGDGWQDILTCQTASPDPEFSPPHPAHQTQFFMFRNLGGDAGFQKIEFVDSNPNDEDDDTDQKDGELPLLGRGCEVPPLFIDVDGDGVVNVLRAEVDPYIESLFHSAAWNGTPDWYALSIAGNSASWHSIDLAPRHLYWDEFLVSTDTPYWPTFGQLELKCEWGLPCYETQSPAATAYAGPWQLKPIDFNGDGLVDLLNYREVPSQTDRVVLYLNTGHGFEEVGSALAGDPSWSWYHLDNYAFYRSQVVDWNGDGRQDLVIPVGNARQPATLRMVVHLGSGGILPFVPMEVGPWGGLHELSLPVFLDNDGDGDVSMLLRGSTDVKLVEANLQNVDYLESVTDGLGHRFSVGYATAADPVYDMNVAQCDDNTICARKVPGLVASTAEWVRDEDQLHTGLYELISSRRYDYIDGRSGLWGRGWLGFSAFTERTYDELGDWRSTLVTNLDNSTYVDWMLGTSVRRFYPYAGLRDSQSRNYPAQSGSNGLYQRSERSEVTEREVKLSADWMPFAHVSASVDTVTDALVTSPNLRWTLLETQTERSVDLFGNVFYEEVTASRAGQTLETRTTETAFSYGAGKLAAWLIRNPDSRTTSSTTDEGAATRQETFTYYANGAPEQHMLQPGNPVQQLATNLTYDTFGNVASVAQVDSQGATRSEVTLYAPSGLTLRQRVDAAGLTYTYHFDSVGSSYQVVGPNGLRSGQIADGFGRIIQSFDPYSTTNVAYGIPTSEEAGDRGQLKITTATVNGATDIRVHDAAGRTLLTRTTGQLGTVVQRVMDYDYASNLLRITSPHAVGHASPGEMQKTYDNLGRLRSETWSEEGAPGGLATREYRYDPAARADRTDWDPWSTKHAAEVVRIDEGGIITESAVDRGGRVVAARDALGNVTQNRYGAFGVPTRVTDSEGNETTIEFDNLGRRVELIDPDTGTESTTYNAFGEVNTITNGAGSQTLAYDSLGRLIERAAGTTRKTWDYDGAGPRELGQLVQSTVENNGTVVARTTYGYAGSGPGVGRLASTTLTVGGESFTTSATYRALGLVDTVQYPSGAGAFAVQRGYDAAGYLTSVSNVADGTTYWSLLETDQGFRVGLEEFGDQTQTRWSYKSASGRLDELRTTELVGGQRTNIQRLTYGYDARGRVDLRTDHLSSARSRIYLYDDLDRLEDVQDAAETPVESFAYDAIGNLREMSSVGELRYDGPRPHAVTSAGTTTYEYDARGNQSRRLGALVAGSEQRLTYTPFGMPATVRDAANALKAQITYDADDTRVRLNQPNVADTFYMGSLYEERRAGNNTEYRYRIWADGREVAQVSRTRTGGTLGAKTSRYLHPDGLGSVDTVSSSGAASSQIQYSAFGNVMGGGTLGGAGVTSGFTGHRHDDDLGLIDMKGRLYDRTIGRFISPDPLVARAHDSQSLNRYSYVGNNPTNLTDPSGFQAAGPPVPEYPVEVVVDDPRKGEAAGKSKDSDSRGERQPPTLVISPTLYTNGPQTRPTPAPRPAPVTEVPAYKQTIQWKLAHTDHWLFRWMQNENGLRDAQHVALQTANLAATVLLWELAIPRLIAAGAGGTFAASAGARTTTSAATTQTAVATTAARGIAPSSRALGQALEAAGQARPAESAAHHIVAGTSPAAAAARAVLQRFGIGINDAVNGVFLPATRASANPTGAAVHSTVHTNSYYQTVNQMLGAATTRAEAEAALGAIRQALLGGGL